MKKLLQQLKSAVKSVLKKIYRVRRRIELSRTETKITPQRLKQDLIKLGVTEGDTLFIHSSLKSIGYLEGGPKTLIDVLLEIVTPSGTLIFPTYYLPCGTIYETCKMDDYVFDIRKHGTNIGRLPEAVIKYPNVQRSLHPTHSVSAIGYHSKLITETHHLAPSIFGKGSPWDRFLEVNGKVLGLGVSMGPITFYHMLEDRMADKFPLPVRMAECKLKCKNHNNELVEVPVHPLDIKYLPRRIDNKARKDLRDYFWHEFSSRQLLKIDKVGESTSWMVEGDVFYQHLETLVEQGITIYSTEAQLKARPII